MTLGGKTVGPFHFATAIPSGNDAIRRYVTYFPDSVPVGQEYGVRRLLGRRIRNGHGDSPWSWEIVTENLRNYAEKKHTVNNGSFKTRILDVFIVDVYRIVIAGDSGKGDDIFARYEMSD